MTKRISYREEKEHELRNLEARASDIAWELHRLATKVSATTGTVPVVDFAPDAITRTTCAELGHETVPVVECVRFDHAGETVDDEGFVYCDREPVCKVEVSATTGAQDVVDACIDEAWFLDEATRDLVISALADLRADMAAASA